MAGFERINDVPPKRAGLRAGSEACTPEAALENALGEGAGIFDAVDIMHDLSEAGFVIVPKEPTEEMEDIGFMAYTKGPPSKRASIGEAYKAMIAASGTSANNVSHKKESP